LHKVSNNIKALGIHCAIILFIISVLSFVLIQKKQKISAVEYTALYCPGALWYGDSAVACIIHLYCAPLMHAVFSSTGHWLHSV
jgi:hypothetical protein